MSDEELEESVDENDTVDQEEEAEVSVFDLPSDQPDLIEIKDIPTEDIAELPNIRHSYHGIEGLAETMHMNGQLQACWVRPSLENAEHEKPYELIFGYRRKKAAELLQEQEVEGWETIRCEVRDVGDGEELAKVIVENFQREEPSAVAEARAMQLLKDQFNLNNKEVAQRLGCDPSQVSHRLSLLKLAVPEPKITPLLAEESAPVPSGSDNAETTLSPADLDNDDFEADPEISQVISEAPQPQTPDANPELENSNSEEISKAQNYADQMDSIGDPTSQTVEEPEENVKPPMDILGMVERGEISASVAEVITTVEKLEDREKLAELAKKNGWNVKKASDWAKKIKENVAQQAELEQDLDDLKMVQPSDVQPLPHLVPKKSITKEEYERLALYALLRNGMDREILDYLHEKLSVPFEGLWGYVERLPKDEVINLKERMLRRYIGAAHRFSSLEAGLKQTMGSVEMLPAPEYDPDLTLPDTLLEDDSFEELFGLPEAEELPEED